LVAAAAAAAVLAVAVHLPLLPVPVVGLVVVKAEMLTTSLNLELRTK
jgi:hypothetical protein